MLALAVAHQAVHPTHFTGGDPGATLARLHDLARQLDASIREAEDVRARCVEARAANSWPDLEPGFRRLFENHRPAQPPR